MANLTTTSDCPICLCPIPSEPWGVCTPCGHPYHRECWDQVVANHSGRRNKIKGAPCAVCKGCSQGFVPVFLTLDLRTVSEEGVSDSSQSAVGKSDQDLEDKENTYDELLSGICSGGNWKIFLDVKDAVTMKWVFTVVEAGEIRPVFRMQASR